MKSMWYNKWNILNGYENSIIIVNIAYFTISGLEVILYEFLFQLNVHVFFETIYIEAHIQQLHDGAFSI